MKKQFGRLHLLTLSKRGVYLSVAVVMSVATTLVSLRPEIANAAQLTERSVTISSSEGGLTDVEYNFQFDWVTSTVVESLIFQFCDTPLGTCNLPNTMQVVNTTVTFDSQTGFPTNGTAFTIDTTGSNDCNDTGNTGAETMICLTRDDLTDTPALGDDATIELSGIQNPTIPALQNFETVFVRISIYSDQAYATKVHDGTVAAAIVRQLTTTGRVQERLEFCVAAVTDATFDGVFSTAEATDCADFPTTTLVDLGIIDNLSVAISPVDNSVTNPANDSLGVAMVDTNASNGVVITYFPEVADPVSGGDTHQLRSFRVLPTDCADNTLPVLTDQCFESAGATTQAIAEGTELFGLYVACRIHATGITGGNLTVPGDYDGANNTITPGANCENEDDGSGGDDYEIAFRDDGTPATIGTSTTVVDDEMLAIRFAATASPTTPTGQYTVVTTYVATPTY